MKNITLRPYQSECVDIIDNLQGGRHLVKMATGLGKTAVMSKIRRKGRMLILAHREELIYQPAEYFSCSIGFEMAAKKSKDEDIVIASVQSLQRRLGRFKPDDFEIICVDEAHHAAAKSYRKILDFFNPRIVLGFTATPKRGDNVRLDDVFEDIIYDKDLKWGIKNKYLCNIDCYRVNVGYNLNNVKTKMGDFNQEQLEAAVDITKANKSIAEAYKKYAKGQTLIFATSVAHAFNIQKLIPKSCVITAKTKNRKEILEDYKNNKIKCLINVNVFLEGTDVPNINTIIMARPTKSAALYCQAVGRGTRIFPGKDKLILVDCVGVSEKQTLCSAPTLFGIDASLVSPVYEKHIQGDLMTLEGKVKQASDTPESWIKNVELINLWANDNDYNLHDINFYRMPNGDLCCRIPLPREEGDTYTNNQEIITIPAPDEIGMTYFGGKHVPMQDAIDSVYNFLKTKRKNCEAIWNLKIVKSWGKAPASQKQIYAIRAKLPGFHMRGLTKQQASEILNRISCGYKEPFSISLDKAPQNRSIYPQTNFNKNFNKKPEVKPVVKPEPKPVVNSENKPATLPDKTFIIQNNNDDDYKDVSVLSDITVLPDEYVCIYLQTTGTNLKYDDVMRVLLLKCKDDEIISSYDTLVYAVQDSARAFYANKNFTNLNALPRIGTVKKEMKDFIGNLPIIGHKVGYAKFFIDKYQMKLNNTYIDSFELAKNNFPYLTSWSLDSLARSLNLPNNNSSEYMLNSIMILPYLINKIRNEQIKK